MAPATGVIPINTLPKSRFKATALEIMREVQSTGEPLIITDRGVPVLELKPYTEHTSDPLALLKGSVVSFEGPLEPVADGDWQVNGSEADQGNSTP